MESMVNFWRNKKVFITGHTGFKGSWLSLWLQKLEAQVIGYALDPPTPTNLFTEAKVSKEMIDIRGDIRDYQHLTNVIEQHQPEIIFHLAAQPLVLYSYDYPLETYNTNVMGSVHVFEAARHSKTVKAIINVTTDKCYENQEKKLGYHEKEPLGGYDPYSNSKACSELVTQAYRNSYFPHIGLASARAGNVIGGGDWAEDRILTDIISACVHNKTIKLRYPSAIRPWQHVLECLSGYLNLAEKLYFNPKKYADAWNFGPDTSHHLSVADLTQKIINLWDSDIKWEQINNQPLHETHWLQLDSSKARNALHWEIKWNVNQAAEATVSWFKKYYNGQDAKKITLDQINQYSS